ncbi:GntR family transcriptional regulator [Acidocella aminolytica]|uniref:GntR family transcriptional regulator n=1 Tax=Acidocella aminolytica TaxID=33998 RepID=UPI00130D9F28|nr:GntR family transcriptional regulator [Acidocella aminolytica]
MDEDRDMESGTASLGQVTPVVRLSLHEQIVTKVREMIQLGELPPGATISENDLCGSLGISRTPLREALKVLASENLVHLRPHRAPLVSPVDSDEIAELFELLSILEPAAGALACQRASSSEINRLRDMHEQLMGHYYTRERTRYFSDNQAIHHEIVRLAGNKVMLATYQSLQGRVLRARSMANLTQARWAESSAEHEALIRAFCEHDDAAVSRLLYEHTRETEAAVLRALNTSETA